MKRRMVISLWVVDVPIGLFLLYQTWVGMTLNVFPSLAEVKINGASVSTACFIDSDCRSVYPQNDYTKCSEASLCWGGNTAVSLKSFNTVAQSKKFVEMERDCSEGYNEQVINAGTDKQTTIKSIGCPLGFSDGAKERCFLFHCGIDYIN